MLEHCGGACTAKQMVEDMNDVFQRHSILKKLQARRAFFTVEIKAGEKMLSYINRVQIIVSAQKSMGVDIDDQEKAIDIFSSLPALYKKIISAFEALAVRSRALFSVGENCSSFRNFDQHFVTEQD